MAEENKSQQSTEKQSQDEQQASQEAIKDKTGEEENTPDQSQTDKQDNKFDPKELNLKPGQTVRVHQQIKETNPRGELKQRIQVFEGRIIAMKHGFEPGATITVRKISEGIGVEKVFPLYSPNIVNIEPVKQARVRRSKLYYLRNYKKRLKEKFLK